MFYEIFLLVHIILAVVVICRSFSCKSIRLTLASSSADLDSSTPSHTADYDGEYEPYLWPLVAIWGFDRFLRVVRLIYCNFRMTLSTKMISLTKSVVTYNQEADVVKVVLTPGNTLLKPRAGQHYFLYQPFSWKGWGESSIHAWCVEYRTK